MPFLLFFRFEGEGFMGIEVIHSSEASERLVECSNTRVRLEELGPLNHWMDQPAQKSCSNFVKKNVSREEVTGIVENYRDTMPSALISKLKTHLERTEWTGQRSCYSLLKETLFGSK